METSWRNGGVSNTACGLGRFCQPRRARLPAPLAITGKLGKLSRIIINTNNSRALSQIFPPRTRRGSRPPQHPDMNGIPDVLRPTISSSISTLVMVFSQLLAQAGAFPHNLPMGKIFVPRASDLAEARAKDCLTRPRRVPCLCHHRHRLSRSLVCCTSARYCASLVAGRVLKMC